MRRLPPLNALKAFEAAGRHLSFSKAAEELGVTPAAISQQIKSLEEISGVQLFRRRTRALLLTDAAQASLPTLTEAFDLLAEGCRRLRRDEESGVLTVSVAPSFGAKWLVPRLDRFREMYPDFDIRIDATDTLVDFERGDVDVAIRYGRGDYSGLTAHCLMSEIAFPVCSPALLEADPPLLGPADLRHHTLIHVHWKMEDAFAPNWRMWLRAAGLEEIDANRGPRFSMDSLAVQAAAAGQGVALAAQAIVATELESGQLVKPFGEMEGDPQAFCYYVVYPQTDGDRPKVRAFRDWVLAEAAASPD